MGISLQCGKICTVLEELVQDEVIIMVFPFLVVFICLHMLMLKLHVTLCVARSRIELRFVMTFAHWCFFFSFSLSTV
jgi:hypothetical protein